MPDDHQDARDALAVAAATVDFPAIGVSHFELDERAALADAALARQPLPWFVVAGILEQPEHVQRVLLGARYALAMSQQAHLLPAVDVMLVAAHADGQLPALAERFACAFGERPAAVAVMLLEGDVLDARHRSAGRGRRRPPR